jgi:hypothetical protein
MIEKRSKRWIFQGIRAVVVILTVNIAVVSAQSSTEMRVDDPVLRAIANIETAIAPRALAADRILTASEFIKRSAAAKKLGDKSLAIDELAKAEKIILESEIYQKSYLMNELYRSVVLERASLIIKPVEVVQPFPSGENLTVPYSRTAQARFDIYREPLARILEEENVPFELLSVAFVESGLNPLALSPKGARGIWQFMPDTARRYGLSVGPMSDQRTHLEHSTRAAARYLRDLYQEFGDWKLALAAYNTGETRIRKIIDRKGIRDFDEMARRGYLPLETRNYVPAVLARWALLKGMGKNSGFQLEVGRRFTTKTQRAQRN